MDERVDRLSGRLVVGLALATLGVLWTLDSMGLIEAWRYIQWWPALLIVYGVAKLGGLGVHRHTGWGLFGVIAGSALLLGNLNLVHVSIWPLFLIAAGASLIARNVARDRAPTGADADDVVRSFAIMGGVSRRSTSQRFRGGELTAIMGGVELDLNGALPESGRAVLDVFAIWGGIEIRVPETWRVELEVTPMMGGFEDSTRPALDQPVAGTLVVRGFVLMGGGEVTNGKTRRFVRGVTVVGGSAGNVTAGGKEVTVTPFGITIRKGIAPEPPGPSPKDPS